ncbi:MAG TPA: hypothetical protein VFI25_20325 [Planctomycetota bacterium]|jgi:hypothetical protein|nr:hypothetical protein [Planctomycetota bacterium]
MRAVPVFVAGAILGGLALRPSAPRSLAVRIDPPGCKPSPPFAFEVRAAPAGPRAVRLEAAVVPFLDAEEVEVSLDAPAVVSIAGASPPRATGVEAGEPFRWRATLHLDPREAGARVLVHARMRFHPPGRAAEIEGASALREVVLGDPPAAVPGPVVWVGGVETVDVPAVPVR